MFNLDAMIKALQSVIAEGRGVRTSEHKAKLVRRARRRRKWKKWRNVGDGGEKQPMLIEYDSTTSTQHSMVGSLAAPPTRKRRAAAAIAPMGG